MGTRSEKTKTRFKCAGYKLKSGLSPFVILFLFCSYFGGTNSSKLEFSGGVYSNLLVAVEPSLDIGNCRQIIQQIESVISEVSRKLFTATEGQAFFGSVKILIPPGWAVGSSCISRPPVYPANPADSYRDSDIKISDAHPIPSDTGLPWTRQYGACGQSSDDIFLPSGFLLSSSFTLQEKSNLMLHEWAKFRYGVFEEHGYFDANDNPNVDRNPHPPCYARNDGLQFTSCSDKGTPLVINDSAADCHLELSRVNVTDSILGQLRTGVSSLMSIPQLENMSKFCTSETHNSFAPTKQNILCDRRSVMEVIMGHKDFNLTKTKSSIEAIKIKANGNVNGNVNTTQMQTQFQYITHDNPRTFVPGIAFLIDNSDLIKNEFRQRMIKQTAAEILSLMSLSWSAKAALVKFSGGTTIVTSTPIDSEANRVAFLREFPDVDTQSMAQLVKGNPILEKSSRANNNMQEAFRKLIETLDANSYDVQWHIIAVTNSPSEGISGARDLLKATSYTLSLATFEENPGAGAEEWLKLYETSNNRMLNLIPLPTSCAAPTALQECMGMTAHILQNFVQAMRSQDTRRYFQRVANAVIEPSMSGQKTFSVSGATNVGKENFHLFVSVISPSTGIVSADQIVMRSPISGVDCSVEVVYGYQHVGKLNTGAIGCGYEEGTWTITNVEADWTLSVQGLVQSSAAYSSMEVATSMGVAQDVGFNPNSKYTPIYARVTSEADQPVIDATVEYRLFSRTPSSSTPSPSRGLKDDGILPDLLQNDGVYSGYIQDFSSSPSFHSGEIVVVSSSLGTRTRAITSLEPFVPGGGAEAGLLDSRLSQKCCSRRVPFSETDTQEMASSRHVSLIRGFLTSTGFSPGSVPPGRIGDVVVVQDTGVIMTTEFVAPGEAFTGNRISHYSTACSWRNFTNGEMVSSTARITAPSVCTPVNPGATQSCYLHREGLAQDHLGNLRPSSVMTIILTCGIMGVNSAGVGGQSSERSFDIDVKLDVWSGDGDGGAGGGKAAECNSISDDCLPIAVFWGLIGCIGGLVLVIAVIILCWCLATRRRKKEVSQKQEVLMTKSRGDNSVPPEFQMNANGNARRRSDVQVDAHAQQEDFKDSPLYNVYVNKAYIQDSDGGMKLVAADGELLPFDDHQNNNHNRRSHPNGMHRFNQQQQQPVPQRRRSLSASASAQEVERNPSTSTPWRDVDDLDRGDMRIYKTNRLRPDPPPKPTSNSNTYSPSPTPTFTSTFRPTSTSNPHPNPNLSRSVENMNSNIVPVAVARNRPPRMGSSGYANSKGQNNLPARTNYTSQPHPHPHNEEMGVDVEVTPIYASVNRNGRRTPNPTSTSPSPPVQPIAAMFHNQNQKQKRNQNPLMSTFQNQRPKSLERNYPYDNDDGRENTDMPVRNRFDGKPRPQSVGGTFPRSTIVTPTPTPTPSNSYSGHRFDAFPSSESESYSDMSRSVPVRPLPPPMPPPFPQNQAKNPVRHAAPASMPISANLVAKTLPRRSPREAAPPPPPPRQMQEMQQINQSDSDSDSSEEYDDGSDNWDNDDFELPVGASYA